MDAFPYRQPYRCLPLAIANAYGWQLILPAAVTAEWNGGMTKKDLTIHGAQHLASSNFSGGVLTFNVAYVFRTDPGYHLLVTGPTNTFKDGAAPMSAVIETDWLPYRFTVNYKLTRPGAVTCEAGEPYPDLRDHSSLTGRHRARNSTSAREHTVNPGSQLSDRTRRGQSIGDSDTA